MTNFWMPEIAISEKIIRSVAVYVFLFLAFRFLGKRQIGELSPFDFVVLLIIANVVQNAIIGPDNSLMGGLVGATTILLLNYLLDLLVYRSSKARRLLESSPTILLHNGKINWKNLEKEKVTEEELLSALRTNGILEPSKVRYAILEENGTISVISK